MPDAALFRAAAAGELNTRPGFEKAARRMLADPKAHRSVDEFVSEWMRFDRVVTAVKDRRSFPLFTPELGAAMTEETRRLINDAVWNDRNFFDIFTANYAFVDAGPGDRLQAARARRRIRARGVSRRFRSRRNHGLRLVHGAHQQAGETSPTARGLFVREQFLCQHVPDPPPGVNTNLPPISQEKPMTVRERLGEHLSNPSCASCHNLIDPIGFGLEKFDAIGRRMEKVRVTVPQGHGDRDKKPFSVELPIDSSGSIAGIQNSAFSSPKELGRVLAGQPAMPGVRGEAAFPLPGGPAGEQSPTAK